MYQADKHPPMGSVSSLNVTHGAVFSRSVAKWERWYILLSLVHRRGKTIIFTEEFPLFSNQGTTELQRTLRPPSPALCL